MQETMMPSKPTSAPREGHAVHGTYELTDDDNAKLDVLKPGSQVEVDVRHLTTSQTEEAARHGWVVTNVDADLDRGPLFNLIGKDDTGVVITLRRIPLADITPT